MSNNEHFDDFLKRFIREEKYFQNLPLETKDFIGFCRKLGVFTNESELEFFEREKLLFPLFRLDRPIIEDEWIKFTNKNGVVKQKPLIFGLSEGEKEVERFFRRSYSIYGFSTWNKEYLLSLMDEGYLYDPSTRPFQDWSTFKGESLFNGSEKVVSFYSTFQIHWLIKLKESYSFKINFAGKQVKVSSCLPHLNELQLCSSFEIQNLNDLATKLEDRHFLEHGKINFSLEIKKERLLEMYKNFKAILNFLLSIQSIYAPYGRSSSKTITVRDTSWHDKIRKFAPKDELEGLNLTIKEVSIIYGIFAKKTLKILGIKRDDWINLWRSLAWSEKEELEGNIRLGIEYLLWTIMIKKFIEDYCDREIPDIDKISNISNDDILEYKANDERIRHLRGYYERYMDPEKDKNYFYDRYKRLFYLANDFKLDYQPRVMVFVEGGIEERILPEIFKWYHDYPENYGIEFVNFKGVDQLLSTSKNAKRLKMIIRKIEIEKKKAFGLSNNQKKNLNNLIDDLKKTDIVISNWTSFISYNLEKWQIIPFFLSDNEGNVQHFLDSGEPIRFEGESYNVPASWKYLWGIDNENKPFMGKDFEFANFSDEEILLSINDVLDEEITIDVVEEIRGSGNPIKKIDDRLDDSRIKAEVVKKLFDTLFREYDENGDESVLERPIFKVIEKILDLASLNNPPVNTLIERENKKIILNLLKGDSKDFD